MSRICNILIPSPFCYTGSTGILIKSTTKSQTKITKWLTKKRGNIKESFLVTFKFTTFAFMTVWSVSGVGKSWQVSPKIKLNLMKDTTLNIYTYSCILWFLYPRTVEALRKWKPVWQEGTDTTWCLRKQAKRWETQ
jgi:hypothetical protein